MFMLLILYQRNSPCHRLCKTFTCLITSYLCFIYTHKSSSHLEFILVCDIWLLIYSIKSFTQHHHFWDNLDPIGLKWQICHKLHVWQISIVPVERTPLKLAFWLSPWLLNLSLSWGHHFIGCKHILGSETIRIFQKTFSQQWLHYFLVFLQMNVLFFKFKKYPNILPEIVIIHAINSVPAPYLSFSWRIVAMEEHQFTRVLFINAPGQVCSVPS